MRSCTISSSSFCRWRSERMARAPHFLWPTVKQQKWGTRKIHGKHCQTPLFHPVFVDTPFRFSPLAPCLRWSFSFEKREKWKSSSSAGWSISSSTLTELGRPDLTLESWPSLGTRANVTSKFRRDQMETTRQDFSVTFNVSCLENIGKAPFVFFLRQTVAGFLGEKNLMEMKSNLVFQLLSIAGRLRTFSRFFWSLCTVENWKPSISPFNPFWKKNKPISMDHWSISHSLPQLHTTVTTPISFRSIASRASSLRLGFFFWKSGNFHGEMMATSLAIVGKEYTPEV